MKKIIVWTLFYIVDVTSRTFLFKKYAIGWGLYQKSMKLSLDLQEKWKLDKPWSTPNNFHS